MPKYQFEDEDNPGEEQDQTLQAAVEPSSAVHFWSARVHLHCNDVEAHPIDKCSESEGISFIVEVIEDVAAMPFGRLALCMSVV